MALASYARRHPHDGHVEPTLKQLDDYLMRAYAEDVTTGFYQWGTMAAALRLQATGDKKFLAFITAQARKVLEARVREFDTPLHSCAWIEGLATAADVIRNAGAGDALLGRIETRIGVEMDKNRKLQIAPGLARLELGGEAYLASPKLAQYAGAFLEAAFKPYTRIDFTGHCLSAMVKLRRQRAG